VKLVSGRGLGAALAATALAAGAAACAGHTTAHGDAATRAAARGDSAARAAAVSAQRGPRVLLLTQTRGYHHASIPAALAAVEAIGRRDGLAVEPLAGAASLTAARLRGAAAVVFLLTSGELPLRPAGRAALLAFVRRGGGLAGFHSASDTFHRWPAFTSLLGAEFSHHPPASRGAMVVEDGRSAITSGLGSSFRLKDEFYVFRRDPRPRVHVLVRLATSPHGPERPLVWCRRDGGGRVFYDAFGHYPQSWSDPRLIRLADAGLRWASGRLRTTDC